MTFSQAEAKSGQVLAEGTLESVQRYLLRTWVLTILRSLSWYVQQLRTEGPADQTAREWQERLTHRPPLHLKWPVSRCESPKGEPRRLHIGLWFSSRLGEGEGWRFRCSPIKNLHVSLQKQIGDMNALYLDLPPRDRLIDLAEAQSTPHCE